jgi:DNA mismatch repair protein MutS
VIFLRRLVPGGADRSYGLHVARLAGVPQPVVAHAEAVMTRLKGNKPPQAAGIIREAGEPFQTPAEDGARQVVLRELNSLDIANLTPVQALVTLNEWQMRLRNMSTDNKEATQ